MWETAIIVNNPQLQQPQTISIEATTRIQKLQLKVIEFVYVTLS